MDDRLIGRYLNGTASDSERREVEAWFEAKGEALPNVYGGDESRLQAARERTLALLQARIEPVPVYRRLYRYAAAASIILAISAGGYFFLRQQKTAPQTAQIQKQDIAPGHNQATLTLANGKRITLTKGLSGVLATQGKTTIQATRNDIAYNNAPNEDQLNYNTLSTARGEQSPYPLVLADGTKVWLNAESSITFPTVFNGKERIVKLTGEAYFEVRHNAEHPFKVQTSSQTIEDIGTAFDVNAYSDELETTTTLVEGSVKVNDLTLRPGEQTDGRKISAADLNAVTAWKNGYFRFHNENIAGIMRQLSRWYDMEINYQGSQTNEGFNAAISRDKNISAVLALLEGTGGVRFKIEGRRVTVLNK